MSEDAAAAQADHSLITLLREKKRSTELKALTVWLIDTTETQVSCSPYITIYILKTQRRLTLHNLPDTWTNSSIMLLLCHHENFWLAFGLAKLGVM